MKIGLRIFYSWIKQVNLWLIHYLALGFPRVRWEAIALFEDHCDLAPWAVCNVGPEWTPKFSRSTAPSVQSSNHQPNIKLFLFIPCFFIWLITGYAILQHATLIWFLTWMRCNHCSSPCLKWLSSVHVGGEAPIEATIGQWKATRLIFRNGMKWLASCEQCPKISGASLFWRSICLLHRVVKDGHDGDTSKWRTLRFKSQFCFRASGSQVDAGSLLHSSRKMIPQTLWLAWREPWWSLVQKFRTYSRHL